MTSVPSPTILAGGYPFVASSRRTGVVDTGRIASSCTGHQAKVLQAPPERRRQGSQAQGHLALWKRSSSTPGTTVASAWRTSQQAGSGSVCSTAITSTASVRGSLYASACACSRASGAPSARAVVRAQRGVAREHSVADGRMGAHETWIISRTYMNSFVRLHVSSISLSSREAQRETPRRARGLGWLSSTCEVWYVAFGRPHPSRGPRWWHLPGTGKILSHGYCGRSDETSPFLRSFCTLMFNSAVWISATRCPC